MQLKNIVNLFVQTTKSSWVVSLTDDLGKLKLNSNLKVPYIIYSLAFRLFSSAGTVLRTEFTQNAFWDDLLQFGQLMNFQDNVLTMKHANTDLELISLWKKNPERYNICHGYGLRSIFWISLTWLFDTSTNTILTFHKCDKYFGIYISPDMENKFYENIVKILIMNY